MAKNAVNYTGLIPEVGDSFESATTNTTGNFEGIDTKIGVIDGNITDINNDISNVDNTSDVTKMTTSTFSGLNTTDKTIVGAINETIVTDSAVNGNIKIAGDESIVYTHPNHSGDVVSTGDGATTIQANVVDNTKLTQMPTMTIKGNNEMTTSNVEDLTVAEVQAMINGDISSNLMTSSKTIVGAINELNTNISLIDTGAIMGVKFIDNGAGFNVERYGLAKGKTFSYSTNGNVVTLNSDFDTLPIYKYIRRGIFDNNSVLVFDQDAVGYDDTLSTGGLAPHTHWVGVYIPKFYFRINVTFSPTYIMDIAVSDKAFDGSLVHPAFIQHSNSGVRVERDYVVFSAYEGVLVNKSTGVYLFTNRADATTRIASDFQVGTASGLTDYTNYAMTSVNKANAQAPATNGILSSFRTMAQNRSNGNSSGRAITQQQYLSWTAINTLFMVEFASTDWQSILSAGVANLSAGTYNESVSVGYTSSLNAKSGYVTGIVRGSLGTTQVSSYRGIENFFCNIWKFMEGFKKSSTLAQYGIYNITKTNNYSVYVNLDFTNKKEVTLMTTTSNYYKYRNEELIPTNSTVSSAYVPDQYYYDVGGQVTLSGGSWFDSNSVGGFALDVHLALSETRRNVGARLFS